MGGTDSRISEGPAIRRRPHQRSQTNLTVRRELRQQTNRLRILKPHSRMSLKRLLLRNPRREPPRETRKVIVRPVEINQRRRRIIRNRKIAARRKKVRRVKHRIPAKRMIHLNRRANLIVQKPIRPELLRKIRQNIIDKLKPGTVGKLAGKRSVRSRRSVRHGQPSTFPTSSR